MVGVILFGAIGCIPAALFRFTFLKRPLTKGKAIIGTLAFYILYFVIFIGLFPGVKRPIGQSLVMIGSYFLLIYNKS